MNEIVIVSQGAIVEAADQELATKRIVGAILANVSPNTARSYGRSINRFLGWLASNGKPAITRLLVMAYMKTLEDRGMSSSTINTEISAIKLLVSELADNGILENGAVQGILRLKSKAVTGTRTGNWLSKEQVETILKRPDTTTLKGLRDRAILSIAIGCGLRRSELVSLTTDHVAERDGRWVILNLIGKGGKVRTVPMASWVKSHLTGWVVAAKIESGLVFRRFYKGDTLADSGVTDQTVRDVLLAYAPEMNVAAHDLRRTFAKLAQKGGANIQQIQKSLGHSSITTTERYLGTDQDFRDAPSDRIKLDL